MSTIRLQLCIHMRNDLVRSYGVSCSSQITYSIILPKLMARKCSIPSIVSLWIIGCSMLSTILWVMRQRRVFVLNWTHLKEKCFGLRFVIFGQHWHHIFSSCSNLYAGCWKYESFVPILIGLFELFINCLNLWTCLYFIQWTANFFLIIVWQYFSQTKVCGAFWYKREYSFCFSPLLNLISGANDFM